MKQYSSSEKTKISLINSAGELAAKRGFTNVSTRSIAERSGENIGSIHYHFKGKDGLFEEVVKTAIIDLATPSIWQEAAELTPEDAVPEKLSRVIREMVQKQITLLFRSDKPAWHSQVIYQLLQHEGPLYALFEHEVMKPDMAAMRNFFHVIDPEMDEDVVLLRSVILKMPIFAHAHYMPAILKMLDRDRYPEKYLQAMEDFLVCQTQLVLGLPDDRKI